MVVVGLGDELAKFYPRWSVMTVEIIIIIGKIMPFLQ